MTHSLHDVDIPAGGWGSAKATVEILAQERDGLTASKAMLRPNKHDGFTCVSCSWAEPEHPHSVEVRENGIKTAAWELTTKRATPTFFAQYTNLSTGRGARGLSRARSTLAAIC